MSFERVLRWALVAIAIAGLTAGILARAAGRPDLAGLAWAIGTAPVIGGLAVSIVRDLLSGRLGVDAIALLSMSAALALGQPLAGAVVALMYSGGNVLEDIAVARAERDLRSLVDRAPRQAHRKSGERIEDVPVDAISVGEGLLVRAGEIIPVDGIVGSALATIDESAVTGEPIPVEKARGSAVLSGSLNAGETFELTVTAPAGESTYAGIVRMVTAAQTAKAPFVRMADRYALILLPVTLVIAFVAWRISGDLTRSLAVLVAATPCPLILAAPVAFIAGVAQAARRGILAKGSGALEALARAHTVLFDKTGTLTVGGARLLSIEVAPGGDPDEVLRLGASLEQASHHVLAKTVVAAAVERGLELKAPEQVKEAMGSGMSGLIDGQQVMAGARQMLPSNSELSPWELRAIRRASWRSALIVFVAVDGRTIGALLLADELRADTPRAIRLLRDAGVARMVMVTGDRAAAAQAIGAALDLDAVLADRVPSDKVEAVRGEQRLRPTIMVGDGINDAPALAVADVGVALGARGASASSEAADVVILADRLDRVGEAILIAQRARRIALQSIVVGMGLSLVAMVAATLGWLAPVPAAITQEVIDVAVILNALRALTPALGAGGRRITPEQGLTLRHDHQTLLRDLDRLRKIVDALDDVTPELAGTLIGEAQRLVQSSVVKHERDDEDSVYPKLAQVLRERHGLSAMSRAHREILHLARLLSRIVEDMPSEKIDRYIVRDAQRVIEAIETLVRMHTAQEEDIYEAVAA
ncbi:heavy metal translocating P-type ATPase [Bradyrhizobium japonicum]|jgi:heavy metal translocating P-type ATPase|uniref:heavy metal translocating P-type ATPase n=1 Tax=Bradyrhizobium TaxID=374 RepID=UPI00040BB448|nr:MULTISPECIES: heavy metal translocating P-type ATPase [Bradyrhizobium]MBR0881740.1 heavy metal translocating P-type ATPase [Bradyrhizobium liaoningense]MBR0943564.1 heavy metal translocating P-type ATPase [Bradyrhizobium liaoningense]MBR1001322.1 heavy metal translocating P-type ATPase [Bradyrhizobium liaoningense]MBR1031205.1 heavy metal translocating P-type ATPase [Bradyrhizobium liaoningense]MBR1066170.1 heavy metal translocating P-type ATPase [Bradyrhizobium liaoningense]